MVATKVSIVLFVIILGAVLVDVSNWALFAPYGYGGISFFGTPLPGQPVGEKGQVGGVIAGAALVFFAYIG
jgi:APA family basic amino acid/polyamine antiporter